MIKQTISCEGCGSKWCFVGIGNQNVARVVECPLCIAKSMPFSNHFLYFAPKNSGTTVKTAETTATNEPLSIP